MLLVLEGTDPWESALHPVSYQVRISLQMGIFRELIKSLVSARPHVVAIRCRMCKRALGAGRGSGEGVVVLVARGKVHATLVCQRSSHL